MKKINVELVATIGISALSLGIYAYDVCAKRKELKKQTQLLQEIQEELARHETCNCKPFCEREHHKKHHIFHHPV